MANTAPAGTNSTRTIGRSYRLQKSDFGFTDADGNAFLAVKFTTLPGAGTLYYDSNGDLGGTRNTDGTTGGRSVVTAGQTISAADIAAGKLTYLAPPGASGTGYANFTFQVQDNGGTASGGVDLDQSPNTLTFNVTATAAVSPGLFGTVIAVPSTASGNGFKISGAASGDWAGISVSSAGDVNGDGFADVLVGAMRNDGSGGRSD